ncbi:MAG: hypothetical protein OXH09_17220, partial [Gammaproteobacteria bacterium]|nr:hypothetical protein [Gammaproteobacteria bacterium]
MPKAKLQGKSVLGFDAERTSSHGSGRALRQIKTTLDASALVRCPIIRLLFSVRIGQVPVTANPASMT